MGTSAGSLELSRLEEFSWPCFRMISEHTWSFRAVRTSSFWSERRLWTYRGNVIVAARSAISVRCSQLGVYIHKSTAVCSQSARGGKIAGFRGRLPKGTVSIIPVSAVLSAPTVRDTLALKLISSSRQIFVFRSHSLNDNSWGTFLKTELV